MLDIEIGFRLDCWVCSALIWEIKGKQVSKKGAYHIINWNKPIVNAYTWFKFNKKVVNIVVFIVIVIIIIGKWYANKRLFINTDFNKLYSILVLK